MRIELRFLKNLFLRKYEIFVNVFFHDKSLIVNCYFIQVLHINVYSIYNKLCINMKILLCFFFGIENKIHVYLVIVNNIIPGTQKECC